MKKNMSGVNISAVPTGLKGSGRHSPRISSGSIVGCPYGTQRKWPSFTPDFIRVCFRMSLRDMNKKNDGPSHYRRTTSHREN
jgi:hypothetical protein